MYIYASTYMQVQYFLEATWAFMDSDMQMKHPGTNQKWILRDDNIHVTKKKLPLFWYKTPKLHTQSILTAPYMC